MLNSRSSATAATTAAASSTSTATAVSAATAVAATAVGSHLLKLARNVLLCLSENAYQVTSLPI